jgi:hypothetical protein
MLSLGHADPRHGQRLGHLQSAKVTGRTSTLGAGDNITGLK